MCHPHLYVILMVFVLRNTVTAMGDHGIKWEDKTLMELYYADNLYILDIMSKK